MITPPDLRRQSRHLMTEADRAVDVIEKRILFELASRLRETASALEDIEAEDELRFAAAQPAIRH
jgi:hypothetical protein